MLIPGGLRIKTPSDIPTTLSAKEIIVSPEDDEWGDEDHEDEETKEE
jgi:hypothetical protein